MTGTARAASKGLLRWPDQLHFAGLDDCSEVESEAGGCEGRAKSHCDDGFAAVGATGRYRAGGGIFGVGQIVAGISRDRIW